MGKEQRGNITLTHDLLEFDVSTISFAEFLLLYYGLALGTWDKFKDNELDLWEVEISENESAVLMALVTYGLVSFDKNKKKFTLEDKLNGGEEYKERWMAFVGSFGWYVHNIFSTPVQEQTWDSVTSLCYFLAKDYEGEIFSLVPELLTNNVRLLDVGCGKFYWGKQILKNNTNSSYTGVDASSAVKKHAEQFLADNPDLSERFNFLSLSVTDFSNGNFDDPKNKIKDFNFVFLLHIIHWLTPRQIVDVFRYLSDITTEDVKIVIFEDYIDEKGPQSSHKKKAIQKLYGYDVYDEHDIKTLVEPTSFFVSKIKRSGERRVFYILEKHQS